MLFGGCSLLAVPILIPINVTGGGNAGELLELTIGNVAMPWRLWFHLILTYLFCGKLHPCNIVVVVGSFCCLYVTGNHSSPRDHGEII